MAFNEDLISAYGINIMDYLRQYPFRVKTRRYTDFDSKPIVTMFGVLNTVESLQGFVGSDRWTCVSTFENGHNIFTAYFKTEEDAILFKLMFG